MCAWDITCDAPQEEKRGKLKYNLRSDNSCVKPTLQLMPRLRGVRIIIFSILDFLNLLGRCKNKPDYFA